MKYKVVVTATQDYEVIVDAVDEDAAEQRALNMEYSEMKELSDVVEATVIEEAEEN